VVDGKEYRVHRLAWLHVHGVWPSAEIDHIDGIRTNNAIANLRDVDRATNCQNMRKALPANKGSGLLGVYPSDNKWRARITVNNRAVGLGTFDSKETAHEAYLAAKRTLHGGCTI
jgi:hypothetical protein